MPVENQEKFTWYKINKEGRIECTSKGPHKGHEYDILWGILVGIEPKEDSWEGETYYNYHLHLQHPADDSIEILQVRESSSAARGIMLSLYCIPGQIRQVRFNPYRSTYQDKTYTNVSLMYRDHESDTWEKVPEWPKELTEHLPPVKEITLTNGKKVIDDGDRVKYIRGIYARIKKQKLTGAGEDTRKRPSGAISEQVDPDTGEIITSITDASEALYRSPAQAKPALEANVIPDDFEDMDDDLPF